MTPKRAADEAFANTHTGELVTAPSGYDAPPPQVRNYASISPSKLSVPGHWPNTEDSQIDDIDKDAPARNSFLSNMGKWVLAKAIGLYYYIRPQQVIVQPIVRKDGARKKRIIDAGLADQPPVPAAGLADEPPTPPPVLITRPTVFPRTTVFKRGRGRGPRSVRRGPTDLPVPAPTQVVAPAIAPAPIPEATSTPAANNVASVLEQLEHDDSLDFSFSDVQGSSTPPGCSAPAQVIHIDAPKVHVHEDQEHQASPAQRPRSRSIDEISPTSHINIIRKSSATPVRKALLRVQAYTHFCDPEARKNTFTEAPAPTPEGPTAEQAYQAYQAYYNHVETVDQDLSDLPDAPPLEELLEETDPNYVLKPRPLRKSVQWSETATAKPFYYDQAVCDMLDSTLEDIKGSPARQAYRDGEQHDDSDDAHDHLTGSPASSQGQDSPQQGATRGFTGVSQSTFDDPDESLSELQLSEELVSELRDTYQKLNVEASPAPSRSPSPPPSPVTVKELVTPLTSEEQTKLKDVATASNDGKDKAYEIIKDKITAHDFSTLLPRQFSGDPRAWLNDQIVNEYLSLLIAEAKKKAGFDANSKSAPPVHAFSSFFYTTLKKRPNGVARWAKRVNLGYKQYLDANLVLYPICHNGHWRVIAVRPKDRTIEYLDSMGMPGGEFLDALKAYLASELQDAWNESEWTVLDNQRSTQQVNGSDCGVFTILNALALMQDKELTEVLASDGMLDARERIAISLLSGATTTEFD